MLEKARRLYCRIGIGIRRRLGLDHLDSDLLTDTCVLCKVDLTHTTTPKLTNEAIAANL
jgi:hypothetical protein